VPPLCWQEKGRGCFDYALEKGKKGELPLMGRGGGRLFHQLLSKGTRVSLILNKKEGGKKIRYSFHN